jgi:hypothetical protein
MLRKISLAGLALALSLIVVTPVVADKSAPNPSPNSQGKMKGQSEYVGSQRCRSCHRATHQGWSETAHTQKLRDGFQESNYINDGNLSGRSDFFDGVDIDIRTLPGGSKFDQFGNNAPVLGKAKNKKDAFVKIGDKTYPIVYTLGGSAVQNPEVADENGDGMILNDEAQWKQRYITMIGKSHYILPVQFNAKTQAYTTYHPEDWYDDADLPKEIGKNRSYERRCAGCHVTGLEVELVGDEWVMDFADISVGCEACHGPGRNHANGPIKAKKETIINPATLTTDKDLSDDGVVDQVDNLIVRNYVCYHCHSRGAGKYSAGGTTLAYSSKEDDQGGAQLYRPGLDWREFYDISTTGTDYWGGHPTSGDFITSKGHHQQQQDHAFGPHGADKPYDHACFECHNTHKADKEHLVTAAIKIGEDGVEVFNEDPSTNNPLCLACHATHGDFSDLTPDDINTNTGVDETVQDHVKNRAYMDVLFTANCTACHMPDAAKTAIEGDIKSHVFNIIWPNYVQQPPNFSWTGFQTWYEDTESFEPGEVPFATVGPIPNSCMTGGCHRPGIEDDIVTQWFGSGHADGFGEPFNHWNADGAVSASCVRCHTMNGFTQLVNGDTLTAQSVIFPKVLDCRTCHEPNGGGQTIFEAGKVQTVEFPSGAVKTLGDSSNICMTCHQGRESGLSVQEDIDANPGGPHSFINRHYFAAAAILFGSEVDAGFQYPGKMYKMLNGFPAHGGIQKQTCTQCHLRGEEDHHFLPQLEDCSGCHLGIADFEELGRPFGIPNTDYDGDGTGESFQHEIDGLEEALLAEIQTYAKTVIGKPIIYQAGSYPYFFNDTNDNGIVDPGEAIFPNRYTSFDDALLKAAYNYHSNQDPCGDIHNHKYVIQTIIDSIEDLGGDVTGFIRPL